MLSIPDQSNAINAIVQQIGSMIPSVSAVIGAMYMVSAMFSTFAKLMNGKGRYEELMSGLFKATLGSTLFFLIPTAMGDAFSAIGGNSNTPATQDSSPISTIPWMAIGIALGIVIVITVVGIIGWHFSKSWRDKRAIEKGHQKVMREIWLLRSCIAGGAFDEQGLDILNALAYVEDSLIAFKVYKAEATQAEQLGLLKEVKPKLNEITTRFGNAWKDTAIENALKGYPF